MVARLRRGGGAVFVWESDMKKIAVGSGYFALVDDSDFEELDQYTWTSLRCYGGLVYATTKGAYKGPGTPKVILMHRMIMSALRNITVDHVDGNGLNNTRGNLRLATMAEQQKNRKLNKNNKTGYKGVHKKKNRSGRYAAETRLNGQKYYIGTFNNARDAAVAYNAVTYLLHGKYASLNSIEGVSIGNKSNYRSPQNRQKQD